MKTLKYNYTHIAPLTNGGDEMRVMRTIVWKQGFQNHHDNKSKRFFFSICSRAHAAKFLVHFFAVSAFLIPNFTGTLIHHRAVKTSLKSDGQEKTSKSLDFEARVEKSISFIFCP